MPGAMISSVHIPDDLKPNMHVWVQAMHMCSFGTCCIADDELFAQAGLEVDSCSRWHFGSTYVIKARPPQPN